MTRREFGWSLRILSLFIAAFAIGALIRPSGIHDPADQPQPAIPPASPLFPGDRHPEPQASGRQAASAYPWFEGWEFGRRSVCIETGVSGAVDALKKAGTAYRVHGIAVSIRFTYGQCKAAGFGKERTIVISAFTPSDKAGGMKGACAYTQAANYGTLTGVYIRVNVLSYQRTACGAGPGGEWDDVWLHELGHAFGLSHEQSAVSSIMRDGHTTSLTDRAELGTIYSNNPR